MSEDFAYVKENISRWKEKQEEIGGYFQSRNTQLTKEPMLKFTDIFVECLFFLNHLKAEDFEDKIEEIKKLKRKPLNVEERLAFIIQSPSHYHSYIQLKELYVEIEKLVARLQVIENRNH